MHRTLAFITALICVTNVAAADESPTPAKPARGQAHRTANRAATPTASSNYDDVAVRAALLRDVKVGDLRSPTDAAAATIPGTATAGSIVEPPKENGLGRIRIATERGVQHAGSFRDLTVTSETRAVARPVVGARVLRRMSVPRVVAALEPAIESCVARLATGPASTPIFRLSITETGAVERADATSTGGLPADVLTCIGEAVGEAQFGAPGGAGATLTLPVVIAARTGATTKKDPAVATR